MATKSIEVERKDEQGRNVPAGTRRKDPRITGSCLTNEKPVEPMAHKTGKPLIKILACFDDSADRMLIRAYLQQITDREIVLLEADNTGNIQNALHKRRIDLVLTDDQMPQKPAFEWIAEISRRQLAPVVMLARSDPKEVTRQTFQEGVFGYLSKNDLSLDKVSNIINVALDKWMRLQQAKAGREELERLATSDSLTGLYNRRAIFGKLHELINLANRYKEDFSLILLDIDHFMRVNDRYGHLTGDEVLENIAALIRGNVRDTDIAARYAGEEFMIILPRANLSSAWAAAERLRSLVENTELKDPAGNAFAITVSAGLAGWERNDDAASLVSRADEALRKDKEKGRNRVQTLFGPTLPDKV